MVSISQYFRVIPLFKDNFKSFSLVYNNPLGEVKSFGYRVTQVCTTPCKTQQDEITYFPFVQIDVKVFSISLDLLIVVNQLFSVAIIVHIEIFMSNHTRNFQSMYR